jgi:hypothetical protein
MQNPFSFGFPSILDNMELENMQRTRYCQNIYKILVEVLKLDIKPIVKIHSNHFVYYYEYNHLLQIYYVEAYHSNPQFHYKATIVVNETCSIEAIDYTYTMNFKSHEETILLKKEKQIDLFLYKTFKLKMKCYEIYKRDFLHTNMKYITQYKKNGKRDYIARRENEFFYFEMGKSKLKFDLIANIINLL